MPVTITVEHLGSGRFRFVSADMNMDEAKKLDKLLSHNGYSLNRLATTQKKARQEARNPVKDRLRNFYRNGG